MKLAISTDGKQVSAHFGRCPVFTVLEIQDGQLIERREIENPGHHPGYLPQFFHDMGIECIVAGGMGARAAGLFDQYGIRTMMGITGNIDEAVSRLLDGTLVGGESICQPGQGKGYGEDKTECDHGEHEHQA
ncbi:dinitrogenase iron-molybdenum cofactor [bacterium]|nr:dinitrogenase iron-molybdenum cofactor [bacterium]